MVDLHVRCAVPGKWLRCVIMLSQHKAAADTRGGAPGDCLNPISLVCVCRPIWVTFCVAFETPKLHVERRFHMHMHMHIHKLVSYIHVVRST